MPIQKLNFMGLKKRQGLKTTNVYQPMDINLKFLVTTQKKQGTLNTLCNTHCSSFLSSPKITTMFICLQHSGNYIYCLLCNPHFFHTACYFL
jgi:hypothetical protein